MRNSCRHQCITCGVLYECKRDGCRMDFQHERCSMCIQLLNFWFYKSFKLYTSVLYLTIKMYKRCDNNTNEHSQTMETERWR